MWTSPSCGAGGAADSGDPPNDPGGASSGDAWHGSGPVPRPGPIMIDDGVEAGVRDDDYHLNVDVEQCDPCPLLCPLRICTWNCAALFTCASGSSTAAVRKWALLHRIARSCDVLQDFSIIRFSHIRIVTVDTRGGRL